MHVSFRKNYYFCKKHDTDTAEGLFGVDLEGDTVLLGYLYQQEDGQWHAKYFQPEVVRTVKTKDEAKNLLFILATQDAQHLMFIKGN